MNSTAPIRSLLVFAFLISITSTASLAQGTAVRAETFSLKPGGEVVVENARGATRVETWDYQTVRVLAEKSSSGASIEPGELVLMGAQNSVIVQCKQGSGRLDLTLYVPHGAQVQVTAGSWPVDISGVLSSAVVETTSGNIAYRIPSNDSARVSISSALGAVRSTIALTSTERSGMHSLRGQMGSGLAQVILNSQSGNVLVSPGPNSPAVAKVLVNQPRGADPSIAVSGAEVRREAVSPSTVSRDASSRSKPNGYDTPSSAQTVQSNGSVDLAGSDQSLDSSSTTTNGPFVRPRRERNTNSGGSGLKVYIIPSDSLPRGSQDVGGPRDQTKDAGAIAANPSVSSNSSSDYNNANSSANGSIDFAGSDRADSGTNNSRVGPLERDREKRTTSGGGAGLRVRIIPANSQPPRSRDSNPIYDQQDTVPTQPSTVESTPDLRANGNARSDSYSQRNANTSLRSVERDGDLPFDRTNSRVQHESAPVLRRNDVDESAPGSSATETITGGGEDAVVLKAALVSLNVSVTNRAGVALANLKKEEFQIAENGEPQKIEFFQPSTAPFNLVLLLDLSGSIKDKLDVVKSAALRFIDVLGPQDKVAVVIFTDEIRVVSQLTADRDELKRRIKAIDQSRGGTAFYEALWFSLEDTLRGTRGQRNAIVVMSDGVDSSLDRYNPMESRVSFSQLARRLEEADVIVFPIYLDTEYEEVFERGNSSSEAYAISRDQLERIAEVSGGQMFKAEKVSDLAGVYKQVAAAMRTVYSVGYYPTNPEKDGTFRKVRVMVDRPDAAVRARKGYYAK